MIKLNNNKVLGDKFPNNEITLDITPDMITDASVPQEITLHYENDSDLIKLHFLTTHLKDKLGNDCRIILKLPYVPYSRSDRPMLNRTFTLKSVCEFINSLGFFKVIVDEPHSDVTQALLKSVVVRNTTIQIAIKALIKEYNLDENETPANVLDFMGENNVFFICPDNGAEKRYIQQLLEIRPTFANIRTCSKERELKTGRIKKFMLADALPEDNVKHAIIIDDLCSKGTTFIMCASALKERYSMLEKVDLVVTHCESNIYNGDIPTTELIQNVYVSNSMLTKESAKIHKMYI